MQCRGCGYDTDDIRDIHAHMDRCASWKALAQRETEESGDVSAQIQVVTYKGLSDGTYLVCKKGDDINQSHWHVANDGTVLSIKEGGSYLYNRRQIRKNIRDVTGIDLALRWS